jgi:uncharacterized membrane protein YgaE (UPF0421/DUF939 family)
MGLFLMKNNKQLKKQLENKTFMIWKMAIASALSWEVSKLAGSEHPYLAPISVILCLQTTVNNSIRFSYHRMVGTVIGISIVVLVEPYLKVNGWTLGILILAGCFIAKWLKRVESAIHQVALTVLLVFVMEHKSGNYPIDRFRDTLIGAIIAVLMNMLIHPPDFTKSTINKIGEFTGNLNNAFEITVNWLTNGAPKNGSHQLFTDQQELHQELQLLKKLQKDAKESQKYNIFAAQNRRIFQEYENRLDDLTNIYEYWTDTIDILRAWSAEGTLTSEYQRLWSEQLNTLKSFFLDIKKPENLLSPVDLIIITVPEELQKQQYHLSLFQATHSFLRKNN